MKILELRNMENTVAGGQGRDCAVLGFIFAVSLVASPFGGATAAAVAIGAGFLAIDKGCLNN